MQLNIKYLIRSSCVFFINKSGSAKMKALAGIFAYCRKRKFRPGPSFPHSSGPHSSGRKFL
ncbi:Uncharacterized protein dnm_030440 [Desulfonema magnum]|uniref:Uncharacterized protein n=1 Tax=Desulfonema magnum TaxID=45655 RepID=A0A975BKL1_9BACT|nr:Uncharacterized protein dnm_030440 [Desulfonema magnum]